VSKPLKLFTDQLMEILIQEPTNQFLHEQTYSFFVEVLKLKLHHSNLSSLYEFLNHHQNHLS